MAFKVLNRQAYPFASVVIAGPGLRNGVAGSQYWVNLVGLLQTGPVLPLAHVQADFNRDLQAKVPHSKSTHHRVQVEVAPPDFFVVIVDALVVANVDLEYIEGDIRKVSFNVLFTGDAVRPDGCGKCPLDNAVGPQE